MKKQTIFPAKTTPLYIKSNNVNKAKIVSLPGLDNSVLEINGELGVDNIKAAFKIILEIGEDIIGLAKGFSISAAIPVILKLSSIQSYLSVFRKALAEYRDGISTDEAAEIGADLKINFDLEDNNLEDAIERIIDLLPSTYSYLYDTVVNGIALYEGWKTSIVELKSLFKKEKVAA